MLLSTYKSESFLSKNPKTEMYKPTLFLDKILDLHGSENVGCYFVNCDTVQSPVWLLYRVWPGTANFIGVQTDLWMTRKLNVQSV
jgi:hypothetical protein